MALPDGRWRTRDIVVTAVIGVAFGVVFWAWGLVWAPLEAVLGPGRNLLYAVWLIPAVLAPAHRPEAGRRALRGDRGSRRCRRPDRLQWGVRRPPLGLRPGCCRQSSSFAFTLYRVWSFPVLALAAVASAAAAWIHDWVLYFPEVEVATHARLGAMMAISAVVIVAGGSVLLVRALREAGVLEGLRREGRT